MACINLSLASNTLSRPEISVIFVSNQRPSANFLSILNKVIKGKGS